MAKARKKAARGRTAVRASRTRRAKARRKVASKRHARQRAARKKPAPQARPRGKKRGIVAKMTDAVTAVADTLQESNEMARRMGPRGGLSEG